MLLKSVQFSILFAAPVTVTAFPFAVTINSPKSDGSVTTVSPGKKGPVKPVVPIVSVTGGSFTSTFRMAFVTVRTWPLLSSHLITAVSDLTGPISPFVPSGSAAYTFM